MLTNRGESGGQEVGKSVVSSRETGKISLHSGTNTAPNAEIVGTPQRALWAATAGFFLGFAAVALYGPAAHQLHMRLQLSEFALGVLVAVPQLTGSLLRIPMGAWADRVGGRTPMLALLVASMVGMAGVGLALQHMGASSRHMYPLILALGCLSGFGVATFAVGIPQVAYWSPKGRQGQVLGLYGGLGTAAPSLATVFLPYVVATLGLANAYFAWLGVLVLGTVGYAVSARDAPYFQLRNRGSDEDLCRRRAAAAGEELFPMGQAGQGLRDAVHSKAVWGLVLLYFVSFGGYLSLTTWLPTFWDEYHHLDARRAGLLVGLGFTLLSALMRAVGGYLSHHWGGERTAALSYVCALGGAILLTTPTGMASHIVGQTFVAIGFGVASAAVFQLVPSYMPSAVGGATGLVGGLGAFGGFVLPPLLGFIADSFGKKGYTGAFGIYGILAVLAAFTALWLEHNAHHQRDHVPQMAQSLASHSGSR